MGRLLALREAPGADRAKDRREEGAAFGLAVGRHACRVRENADARGLPGGRDVEADAREACGFEAAFDERQDDRFEGFDALEEGVFGGDPSMNGRGCTNQP